MSATNPSCAQSFSVISHEGRLGGNFEVFYLRTTLQLEVNSELNHVKLAKHAILRSGGRTGADIQPTLSLRQPMKPLYPYMSLSMYSVLQLIHMYGVQIRAHKHSQGTETT